ncbi:MAG: hypothetical protein KGI39_00595 [Patescibacteria group bacterium]|nr:hypothetical protein [Patescibacteria group bacterium]
MKRGEKLEFGGTKGGFAKQQKDAVKQKKEIADEIAQSKARQLDKSIRKEQSLMDERTLHQFDLSNEVLKSQKKMDDVKNEHKGYDELMEKARELEAEYQKLFAISSNSMVQSDIDATDAARRKFNAANIKLEDERSNLQRRGVDTDRYEAELENAKMDLGRDQENIKNYESKTDNIKSRLNNLTAQRDNVRNKMRREYAKNLPWAAFGKSLWGDKLAFLDKIFPSYTEAADEIRKSKSDAETILKMIKKQAKEEAKKMNKKEGGEKPEDEEEE